MFFENAIPINIRLRM